MITRRRPCLAACRSANDMADSVLPPPVGTFSEKKPGSISAASRHQERMRLRHRLTQVSGAQAVTELRSASSRSRRTSMESYASCDRSVLGLQNFSVSSESASTRAEKTIRPRNEEDRQSSVLGLAFGMWRRACGNSGKTLEDRTLTGTDGRTVASALIARFIRSEKVTPKSGKPE